MENIPVVILAGGQGMRIREETEFRPKPMINIGDRPILWHIMKIYSHFDLNRFVVCLGYKGDSIRNYFLNFNLMHNDFTVSLGNQRRVAIHGSIPEKEWNVTLAETGLNSMTGARIKKIQAYVKNQTFMVTYGDGVADIDIKALLKFHRSHGKLATVTGVAPLSRFGEMVVKKNKVENFSEKPKLSDRLINGGFFVFEPGVFDFLSDDDQCSLELDPMKKLAQKGQLMVHPHSGFWQCMDTVRDMNFLNELWRENKAPWKIWKK